MEETRGVDNSSANFKHVKLYWSNHIDLVEAKLLKYKNL